MTSQKSVNMASLLLRKTLHLSQFRTLHRSAVAFSVPVTFNNFLNQQKFQEVLPEVMDTLMSSPKFKQQLPEVESWVKKLLNYTIPGGHGHAGNRGMTVPFAYQKMEDPKYFTEEKLHSARFIGWGVEMLEAFLQVVDDIIDTTPTRRGKPSWYLLPNVGTSAINDCLLMYHCLMEVLEIKFGKEPFYPDLVNIFNEGAMHTAIGQFLDYRLRYTKEKNNLDDLTVERHKAAAIQKSSYFMIRLPMLAGMLLVKNRQERDSTELSSICMDLGIILQCQNDYDDIYRDESIPGKASSDVQEGKLSWVAVTALEHCNDAQRAIFKEYYGSKDPEHVKRIKQLYDELQMDKVFEKYSNSAYERLERRIRALPNKGEMEYFLEVTEACRKQTFSTK